MSSNLARERLVSMCLGPSWVAVMKGRLMLVWLSVLSSILAFSAASVSLCRACRAECPGSPPWLCDDSSLAKQDLRSGDVNNPLIGTSHASCLCYQHAGNHGEACSVLAWITERLAAMQAAC